MANVARWRSLRAQVMEVLAGTEWIVTDLCDEIYAATTDPSTPAPMRLHPSPGYGPAAARHERKFAARAERRDERLRSRLRYYRTITDLVHDGIVERHGRGGAATVRLTERGLRERQLRAKRPHVPDPGSYPPGPDRTAITIVSYDIPERERWKRDWVRAVLVRNEYRKLHQSVWLGTRSLPERFLKDARTLRILHHLEIFEVGREGTLKDRTRVHLR
ncbi:MAG: hypothetical protein Q7S84_00715 [bacterium]|nr:hypothetical protein [bacterium]